MTSGSGIGTVTSCRRAAAPQPEALMVMTWRRSRPQPVRRERYIATVIRDGRARHANPCYSAPSKRSSGRSAYD